VSFFKSSIVENNEEKKGSEVMIKGKVRLTAEPDRQGMQNWTDPPNAQMVSSREFGLKEG